MTEKTVLWLDNDFIQSVWGEQQGDAERFNRVMDALVEEYDVRITDVVRGEAVPDGATSQRALDVKTWIDKQLDKPEPGIEVVPTSGPTGNNRGEQSILEAMEQAQQADPGSTHRVASNDTSFDWGDHADSRANAATIVQEETIKGNVGIDDYKGLSESPGNHGWTDFKDVGKQWAESLPDGTPGKASILDAFDNLPDSTFESIFSKIKGTAKYLPVVGTVIAGATVFPAAAQAASEGDIESAAGILADYGLEEAAGDPAFVAAMVTTWGALGPVLPGWQGKAVAGIVAVAAGLLAATGVSEAAKAAFNGLVDQLQDWGLLPQDGFLNDLMADYAWGLQHPGLVLDEIADWMVNALYPWLRARLTGSPLVLDLDGDGVELVSLADSNIYWDIDQDGFAESIGWVQADDGFLAIDANADGIITDHSELFGSVAEDGFTDLRLLDSNSDNVIDANDTAFADLLVWRDLNQNGTSEANELFSLDDLNIVSINLNATAVNQTNAGHDISHVSTYTVNDGVSGPQTLAIVDVWFEYDDVNTDFIGSYTLDLASLFVVNQRGYGLLPDLYIAASQDNDLNDPDSLLSLLTAFSAKSLDEMFVDDGSALADAQAILFRWAGVDTVAPGSRGPHVDARKLEFLEELFGQDFLQGGSLQNPAGMAGDFLDESFDIVLDAVTARLIAQGAGQALFSGSVFYNPLADGFEGVTGLNLDTLDIVLSVALDASKVSDKVAYWQGVVNVIDQLAGVADLSTADRAALDAAIAASDSTLTTALILESLEWLSEVGVVIGGTGGNDTLSGTVGNDTFAGGAGNDTISGGIGNDFINGQSGDDVLNGQSGNDTLRGEAGNDTYLYFAGQGHDTIRENGSGTDRILFGPGITFSDLTFTRINNDDLLIEISEAAGGGKITIELQFRTSDAGYIEILEFADSSTVALNSLVHTLHGSEAGEVLNGIRFGGSQNDIIYGYGGDDVIYGYSGGSQDTGENVIYAGDGNDTVHGGNGIDWIEGGAGNDTLKGNSGADTINGGDGNDTIHGGNGADLLIGGAGDDVIFGDNDNDILSGGLGADELTGGTGADTFRFEAGQTFDAIDTIKDFNVAQGDRLDIRNILEGYNPETCEITDFVQITESGGNSIVAVDADGGGDNFVTIAILTNRTGLTDEAALESSGRLWAA